MRPIVTEIYDYTSAVEAFAAKSQQIIILDWDLPEAERKKICDLLAKVEKSKNFYLILTTDEPRACEISKAIAAGADDFLLKPYSADELEARMTVARNALNPGKRSAKSSDLALSSADRGLDSHLQWSNYQNLFSLVHDPVIIFDPITNLILDVNETACLTYKIERKKFIGLSIKHLWIDSRRESEMFGVLFEDGFAKNFETVHLRSDGFRMNIVINSSIIEYCNKKAILSINQNITEQRRAEEGIKLAMVEWRDTVDAVPDMIILEDGEGTLRRCNKATINFLGLPYERVIGRSMKSLFSVSEKNHAGDGKSAAPELLEHLRSRNWEGLFDKYDRWFEINNRPITSELKSETQWVHVIRDITKRKIVEDQLRKFFTVVDQSASSILITDLSGNIQYVNSMIEDLTEIPKDRLIGKNIFEINPNISKQILNEEIIPTLEKNNTWQRITKTKREGEEIFEEITVSKVKANDGKALNYVFVCRDVTETRQLESIAEAVNMMDNVGYIFSGIRHELGNPINSAKMALTVLGKNLEKWNREQIGVYVERCLSEISRVEYLLRALKSFSLHENPRMEEISLPEFMESFISFTNGDFEKRGVSIALSSKIKNGKALCDPRALHQIMLNLIANSVDAVENRPEPKIVISLGRIKNRFQVSVEDNGIGMNEKQLNNLFRPFYTSKENGTGLGLVIVQKMLVRMNGTISVASSLDSGTQVNFTLEAPQEKSNERK